MKNFEVKKMLTIGLLLLPILALLILTLKGNTSRKKGDLIPLPSQFASPSDAPDDIASLIESEDYETALLRISEKLKDPNIPTSAGTPLLVIAAEKNNNDIAGMLLARGASVNLPDVQSGETALMKAAQNDNMEMISIFIGAGADVNAESKRGVTALTAAAGNKNQKVVDFLISRGARAGMSQNNMLLYAFASNTVGVDAMLKGGINPNFSDSNGNTPLIITASRGDAVSVKALVAYRAQVNAQNNLGMTPLLYAIKGRYGDIVEFLIDRKADIKLANNLGETPLYWAAYQGNAVLAQDLLTLGADYKVKTKTGLTALEAAEKNKNQEAAKAIKDFIAYKNIPRDAKGNPIIPKKPAAQASAGGVSYNNAIPTPDKQTQQAAPAQKNVTSKRPAQPKKTVINKLSTHKL